jgi:hypothetical protein
LQPVRIRTVGLPTCYKARTNHYKSTPIKKLGGKKEREKKLRLFDQLSKIIGFETPLLYLSRLGLGLLLDDFLSSQSEIVSGLTWTLLNVSIV